jgi:hypothetical protein
MMVAAAMSGLPIGFVTWLSGWIFDGLDLFRKLDSTDLDVEVIIEVGPYNLSSRSPSFWPILCLGFAVAGEVLFGAVAVVHAAVMAIRRRLIGRA